MRKMPLFVIAGLMGALLACGQKGPLVLPDKQHPHKKIGLPKPPPAPTSSPPAGTAPAPAPSAPTDPTSSPVPASGDPTIAGEAKPEPALQR